MEKYFLGANSGSGFYSLYDSFCREKGDFLHLIKGGPGCGKSSFMRRIAEKAEQKGMAVEYILCSGDPDSLDGIYIPELKLGYADATSPHVIEPRHFATDSDYVNLGQFCGRAHTDMIGKYTSGYKACYDRAYSLLAAAAEIKSADFPGLLEDKELLKIKKRARSAVSRSIGKPCGEGRIKKRFIHCISCMGEYVLTETLDILCKQIYLLDNRLGLAKYYLNEVIEEAKRRKDDILICPSPLLPDEAEAVIFPAQGVGFIVSDICSAEKPYGHVRLDAIISAEKLCTFRQELKNSEKLYSSALISATACLASAKSLHDELEKAYRPYVNFAALDEYTQEHIKNLFA